MADPPVKDAAHHRVDSAPATEGNRSGKAAVTHPSITNANPSTGRKSYIEQLISSSSVLDLEAAVQAGVRLLGELKVPLKAAQEPGNFQVNQWIEDISQLEKKAKPARTVVGVVGVTGAGKSSVINALLDEERLVPTSGMRACTASATEISYNHSDDPNELYRAEVEFISEGDWSQELKTLLGDLMESSGKISPDCYNADTDAGLAYSKIRAVYPQKTRENIVTQASVPWAMAREPQVLAVLGSIKRLRATSSSDLFEDLQKYIDSKDHNEESKETNNKKKKKKMEFWPLIKVVRIYCKAPALSTGVVMVDLPGVQDSNAARAAVAENYMKACHGIWITADVQRAVNAKTAKKLLGDSFKRQLKYDGALYSVTFVCTKTDDILKTEVQNSLNVADEVGDYERQSDLLQSKRDKITSHIESLKQQKGEFDELIEELDQDNEQWEELQEDLADGKPVYPPSDISKKRKREISPSEISDTGQDDSGNGDISHVFGSKDPGMPLTEQDIKAELATIKIHKKEARRKKKKLDEEIKEAGKALAEVTDEEKEMQSDSMRLCIQGRNLYVKGAIKKDFALGIKELDQEVAIEEDEANFDPEEEKRDYEELARSLPVFCVSSRAYQKLAGRLEKDVVHTDGFTCVDDTEIPQLQEHARRVTERGRICTSQLFLNELNRLLHSMIFWATGGTRPAMMQEEVEVDENLLDDLFTKLDNSLREAIEDCHSSMKHDLDKHLSKSFDRLIPAAFGSSVETATGWGKPRSENGLFWATYKATCRRDGCFDGACGKRDFNAELLEPITSQLAGNWERVFQRRVPRTLRAFAEECKSVRESFHDDVSANVVGDAASWTNGNGLDQQKRVYQKMLGATPNSFGALITEKQREANRGFIPVIQAAMQPAYDGCVSERGIGQFVRMKAAMQSHVATVRKSMFRKACASVEEQLDLMCAEIEQSLTVFVQDLLSNLRRDYLATLTSGCTEASSEIPMAEKMLRDQIKPLIDGADSRFAEFCFLDRRTTSATADGSERDESLIAQQLPDGMIQYQEDVINPGTETNVKSQPL